MAMTSGVVVDTAGRTSRESRIGPVIELPRLLQEHGVKPGDAFSRAGVCLSLFDSPDNRITGRRLSRLLSECVNLTGRQDFGLLLGSRFRLENLGPLGELMRHSVTAGEALRVLLLHLHFYDREAIPVMLRMTSSSVFLGYTLQQGDLDDTGQWQDAAIAIAHRMMRALCGPSWRPLSVQFSHRRPASIAPYRRVFGPGVRFDAPLSGLSFAADWLEHAVAGADPARWCAVNDAIRRAEARWPIGLAEEVQCVLHQLLPGGNVSSGSVARLFGCSERTLRQKLRAEGVCLQQLLAATRFDLARHLLQGTALPMSRIAESLCYSDAAVFSRAFHGWAGMSPREFRTGSRKQ